MYIFWSTPYVSKDFTICIGACVFVEWWQIHYSGNCIPMNLPPFNQRTCSHLSTKWYMSTDMSQVVLVFIRIMMSIRTRATRVEAAATQGVRQRDPA